MNELTKIDLQIILLDMTIYANKTTLLKESPSHKELRDKIESMIDNYCEHTESKRMTNCGTEYCVQCKKILTAYNT